MQGFLDDLVGYVRIVEVAGINVVEARGDGLEEYRDSLRAVTWRAENVGAGGHRSQRGGR